MANVAYICDMSGGDGPGSNGKRPNMDYPKNAADILITKDSIGFFAIVRVGSDYKRAEDGLLRPASWSVAACEGPCASNYEAEAQGKAAALSALGVRDVEFSPYNGNTVQVPYTANVGVWVR